MNRNKILAIAAVAIIVIAAMGVVLINMKNPGSSKDLDVNLEIYGNADKDWNIDEDDAKLVEDYISAKNNNDSDKLSNLEKKMNLTFADANHDGKIDDSDVKQIRDIVKGTAKNLWFLDGNQKEYGMDISNIQRIGCEYFSNTEAMLILGQNDKIVAVDNAPFVHKDLYFTPEQQRNLTNMFNMSTPDFDFINSLNLDVLLTFSSTTDVKADKLPGVDVLYLGLYLPDLTNTSKSAFIQGILKAGYIFGAVDRAVDYTNWILDYRDRLLATSNSINDDDKPVVMVTNYINQYLENGTTTTMTAYTHEDPLGQAIELAGGKNIIDKLGIEGSGYGFKIGIDSVFTNSPVDYFFCHNVKYTYGGSTTTAPDHGYLVDDYSQFKNACEKALSQELMTDESVTMLAGDFRNGCTGGVLLAAYMGNLINHDAYSSIDPLKMHQEYIGWMGIDNYDISKHGVFFYTAYPE